MKAWLCILPVLMITLACSRTEPGPAPQPAASPVPILAVTLLPQRHLVRELLGEPCEVIVMVPPGSSPETYAPTPQQMQDLSRAVLYVRIGHIAMETAWLNKLASSYPNLHIVDPSRGLAFLSGHIHHHAKEEQGHASEESQSHAQDQADHETARLPGIDPHIWLSAPQMIRYCRNLAPILSEHFPQRAPAIEANLSKMTQAMERLHQDIDQLLTPHRGKGFMVFHPAWGYFARDYGLLQWAIEDEGKSPSPKHLKAMTDEARKRGIDRIFIQNQFERRNAEALAEALGIRVVELDPLLEDWPAMMMQTARSIVEGFQTP